MTCHTKRVRYLPGDLVQLSNGELAIIIASHYNDDINRVYYTFFSPRRYIFIPVFSDGRYVIRKNVPCDNPDLRGGKILHRIFESQRNYVCQEDNCIVKDLLGECYGCSLKVDYSKENSNIFIPGDTVWVPKEKRETVISDINLCIRDPWPNIDPHNNYSRGFVTISQFSSWSDSDIFYFVTSDGRYPGYGELRIEEFYEFILANPDQLPALTYYETLPGNKINQLPRNIKMREQSKHTYFIPENASLICNSCIYTDCENCKTKKLIRT